ncbi:MAG: Nramp family divalent metal transporter [Bacillota bacterium]|nr:Nramp family divalent metal transporter [Bacillota bacterium]
MMAAKTTKSNALKNIFLFLAILGPGIITGSVDNDVGGITTYSIAGATYGNKLIWTLIPAFLVLFIVQEMNARMGIVTGKGLADLIRENAGVKITFFIFIGLLGADILNTTTEFAGVAGSMQIFGVSKYIAVPIVAVIIWFLVVKGTYRSAEKIFLAFSVCLLVYVVAAILGHPDWNSVGHSITHPDIEMNFGYISTVIGLIGTTIAPWMQFYMQSAVIEKGLKLKDYKFTLLDILVGCIATIAVAFFIIVACSSTLYHNGVGTQINTAKDAALSLKPIAGALASQVFAFGLFIASIFAAVILPVATAFYVCEAFGFEAGIDKKWEEAPQFYWLYTFIIFIGIGIVLLPNSPLIKISFWSQIINGILLPVVLICMMIIVNKKDVMGKYTNKPIVNIIGWITITILILLSVIMLVTSIV